MADESVEDLECPETGFHDDKEKEEADTGEEISADETKIITERVKFLRETIRHCRHFISMVACPQWQLLSMEVVAASIVGLVLEQ